MQHEWLIVHRNTETDYWWFVNKRRAVRGLLGRYAPSQGRLLEVGCGGGLFSAELATEGWKVFSADLSPAGAAFAHAQGVPAALAFDAGRHWPLAENSMDVCILLDVLEHVEQDKDCLGEIGRVLRPGGIAVLTVPAYPFLFSAWDTHNTHYRRYTVRSLSETARAAGLEISRMSYWNAISVPPACVMRLKDKFFSGRVGFDEFPRVPRAVNAFLKAYGRLEAAGVCRWDLPFGLSVLAVLRKRKVSS